MNRDPGDYIGATKHPWPCFLFLLPFLAAYEGGVLWLGGTHPGPDSQQAAQELKESAQERAESVKQTAADAASTVKGEAQSAASDVKGQAQDSAGRVRDQAGSS